MGRFVLTPLGPGWAPLVARALASLRRTPEADRDLPEVFAWLDLLAEWNSRLDLTAARTHEEFVDLMLADAAFLATRAASGAAWVDVGSGSGAPGLALALLRRDLRLTLVEPLQKRVAFLRTVVGSTTTRARVQRTRGEALAERRPAFDVALSRATLPPPAWLALGARLVHPAGAVWVLLAREAPPTLEGWQIVEDQAYAWPLTGATRRAVCYRMRVNVDSPSVP